MILPGRLSRTTLGDVLGSLHRAGTDGVLELIERPAYGSAAPPPRHRVVFAAGLIQQIESSLGAPRLGELLTSYGVLNEESLRALRDRASSPIGETLVEAELVRPEVVSLLLHAQLRGRLEALFSIADADVRFHARSKRPAHRVKVSPLFPSDFLSGRPRFRDLRQQASHEHPERSVSGGAREPEASADAKDLTAAQFRALAKKWHPDKFPHATPEERSRYAHRFAELSRAYHRL